MAFNVVSHHRRLNEFLILIFFFHANSSSGTGWIFSFYFCNFTPRINSDWFLIFLHFRMQIVHLPVALDNFMRPFTQLSTLRLFFFHRNEFNIFLRPPSSAPSLNFGKCEDSLWCDFPELRCSKLFSQMRMTWGNYKPQLINNLELFNKESNYSILVVVATLSQFFSYYKLVLVHAVEALVVIVGCEVGWALSEKIAKKFSPINKRDFSCRNKSDQLYNVVKIINKHQRNGQSQRVVRANQKKGGNFGESMFVYTFLLGIVKSLIQIVILRILNLKTTLYFNRRILKV